MIYPPPERATPAVRGSLSGEIALALVAMALLTALVLQFTCSGWTRGSLVAWVCVNNQRLAAIEAARATPTVTSTPARQRVAGPAGFSDEGFQAPAGIDGPQVEDQFAAALATATALAAQRPSGPILQFSGSDQTEAPPVPPWMQQPFETPRPFPTPLPASTSTPTDDMLFDLEDLLDPGTPTMFPTQDFSGLGGGFLSPTATATATNRSGIGQPYP